MEGLANPGYSERQEWLDEQNAALETDAEKRYGNFQEQQDAAAEQGVEYDA